MRSIIVLIIIAGTTLPQFTSGQCNGEKNLCYKRYSDVAFLITNNAYTPLEDMMVADQSHSIAQQLQNNVDGLVLNVDLHFGRPVVYFRSPLLGYQPLKDVFVEVGKKLKEDPDKILTLIINSKVPNKDWSELLRETGLTEFLYVHGGGEWPVLRNMIDDNERLVVFAKNVDKSATPLLHDIDQLAISASTDLCSSNSSEIFLGADADRDFLVMDHHADMLVSEKIDDLIWINSTNVLLKRSIKCWDKTGEIPNFILVDHYQIGNALHAIRTINNITEGLAENVDPRNFEMVKDPLMEYSTVDLRGFIRKDHKLEIWENGGVQVASVENVEYVKMYIPRMALAFGSYHFRVLDPENNEISKGNFLVN